MTWPRRFLSLGVSVGGFRLRGNTRRREDEEEFALWRSRRFFERTAGVVEEEDPVSREMSRGS